ncbi:eukaryotic translation initiation factor 3 subunit 10 [Haematococcus lacustris]|uniref:Eukaryotic translation initiation factor 3 subunit 10 n=1 Tax=Haematococcus lacustris TaxID=44745 RepID=A0A699ZW65_HAELA|nr:eukaryotic translation initiation factor 3 subunit 10 [Haematococcus lacustris]
MERAGAVSAAQAAKKAEIVALALENTEALHSLAHARKLMIEKRKEDAENALLEAERESQRLREQQEQDAARLAERRAKEDALRREKDRIEAELQEQEKQELMAMMEARMKSGKVGSKLAAVMKGAEGKELDRDTILREAQAERLKEQQELERKMTKVARQLDHLERARREEEAPVLARLAAEREAEERALYEESVRQEAVRHRAGWEQDMADRVRILKTLDDKAVFEAQVIARRREEFEEYRRQQLAKQAQRRAQRRAEITSQRIERFLEQCRKEVAVRVADIEAEEAARLKEEKKKVVKRPSHISASAKKLCHGCKYSKSGVLQLRALFDEVE